ncbi:MAG: nuclear transport factor 2 family protein [Candidatus Rokubacteria bacterium]|nr:nuclear transport factor 2 family protein [Candidatus Rokubacteria bacterium]MBI3827375.1 nuclear transport factor 2 family protein [Candidatus Rokubacteria bacterium]
MSPGDEAALEEANARFYRAFEALDLAEMDKVWLHGAHVKCVHPGWPLLVGWEAVRQSWEAIFENTAEMRFTITDVAVVARAELAWVTCTENILSEVDGRLSAASVLATNLFERSRDGWRLALHHASHVLGAAPAE